MRQIDVCLARDRIADVAVPDPQRSVRRREAGIHFDGL